MQTIEAQITSQYCISIGTVIFDFGIGIIWTCQYHSTLLYTLWEGIFLMKLSNQWEIFCNDGQMIISWMQKLIDIHIIMISCGYTKRWGKKIHIVPRKRNKLTCSAKYILSHFCESVNIRLREFCDNSLGVLCGFPFTGWEWMPGMRDNFHRKPC